MKIFSINTIQLTLTLVFGLFLSLSTNAQNTFPATGRVGIGTNTPQRPLHIKNQRGLLRLESTSRYNWAEFYNNSGYLGYIGSYLGEKDLEFGTSTTNPDGKLHLITTTKPRLTVLPNGNVGIGTINSAAKLHVFDNNEIARLQSSTENGWLSIYNKFGYQGYFGTYSGDRDIDVGTGASNTLGKLHLVTKATPRLTVNNAGNVGIGTTNPTSKLHVEGHIFIHSGKGNITYGYPNSHRFQLSTIGGGQNLQLRSISNTGSTKMVAYFKQNGGVGINTNNVPVNYKLAVDGRIICEELKVQLSQNWPDYVFEADYDLPSLTEVENSIKANGHLPGIPAAAEIEAEGGIEVGEMQRLMMEKIEELTLYLIDLKKENESLKTKVEALEATQK